MWFVILGTWISVCIADHVDRPEQATRASCEALVIFFKEKQK